MPQHVPPSVFSVVVSIAIGLLASSLWHALYWKVPLVACAVLLTGGTFLLLRQPSTRTAVLVLVLPLLLILSSLTFTPMLHRILTALTVQATPRHADAIVILGGGVNCTTGVLTAASQERLEQGIRLWQAGYASTLVLSQQADALYGADCPKVSDVSLQLLQQRFPAQLPPVEILHNVMNTHDEAVETARLITHHRWQQVLLVTSSWHSRRAALMFAKVGVPFTSVPAPAAVAASGFIPTPLEQYTLLRELAAYVKAWVQGEL
ncbi:YdcF family protein [Deinococcus ruber]|nr:YdcF family protein [Deinococcus ruber]